ncbi:MFS transporter [Rhizobium wuzhouense]|uniref:MFS transporter n=1 Tax=Rhizobium wuzhouense TaxID=1986026 RepID=A0ABX5NRV1_9HYPH|nr:MFS transporter [Rhizobium wuzhouense]PYB73296.1 MFS transporter [Rhizobium wuzhouense]
MKFPSAAAKNPALVVLAGSMLVGSLGISLATVALPALAKAFAAPIQSVQWVIIAYLVAVTASIVVLGRLADIIGQTRVLILGLTVFALASLACALAPSLSCLIAARIFQGLGGAVLMALPVSMIRTVVAKEKTGSAMGLLGTMSAVGTALGPSLGGLTIERYGWNAGFLAVGLLGLMLLILAIATFARPTRSAKSASGSIDWLGSLLLALALSTYALSMTAGNGALDARGLLTITAVLIALFVWRQKAAASPLVPIALVGDRRIGLSLAMNLLVTTVMMSTLVVGPYMLSLGLGLGDSLIGLVMAIGPLTSALSGVPSGRLTDRYGAARMLPFGLLQIIVGLVALAILPRLLGLWGYGLALVLLTPGFQIFLAANNTVTMQTVAEDQRGVLSGLLGLSRNLGFVTGASAMSGLFAYNLGVVELAMAAPALVADAFTVTFVTATALPILALIADRLRR